MTATTTDDVRGSTQGLRCRIEQLERLLRPTPLVPVPVPGLRLFAKLEYMNPVGSIKDRSAYWILKRAVERGQIGADTTVIESSSGNFAIALASYAQLLGLRFIPVIDPNILPMHESFLRRVCDTVVKVDAPDDTGGYLKTRLNRVHELCARTPGAFWTNQYGNADGMEAHYALTAEEVCGALPTLDYAFIGVSTGGTIVGMSRRLKERYPAITIVAVDAKGSVIFGGPPQRRHIPGLGASIVPPLIVQAHIDEIAIVSETEAAAGCRALLWEHGLFVGGSTGSSFAAVQRFAKRQRASPVPTAIFLCADRGTAYLDTVFDSGWISRLD
jgi:cysteine synthase A